MHGRGSVSQVCLSVLGGIANPSYFVRVTSEAARARQWGAHPALPAFGRLRRNQWRAGGTESPCTSSHATGSKNMDQEMFQIEELEERFEMAALDEGITISECNSYC